MSSFFHHQWGGAPSGVHHEHDARPSSHGGSRGDQTFASWMGAAGDNVNYGDALQHSHQGHYGAIQHDANGSHYGSAFDVQQDYGQTTYAPQRQAYGYSGYHSSAEIDQAHGYHSAQQPIYDLTIPPPPPPPPPVIPNPPPAPPQPHASTKVTAFARPESNLKDSSSAWGEWQERERYVAAALGVQQQEPVNQPSQDPQQQQYFGSFPNEGQGSQHEDFISSSASPDIPAWSTGLPAHTDIGTQHTTFRTEKPSDNGSGSSQQVAALSALDSLSRLESKWNKKDGNPKRRRSARRRKNVPPRAAVCGSAAPSTQLRALATAGASSLRQKASKEPDLDIKMSSTQVRRVSRDADAEEEEGEIKVEDAIKTAHNATKHEAKSPAMDQSIPKVTTDNADDDDMDLGSSDEDSVSGAAESKQERSTALTKVSDGGAVACGSDCAFDTSRAMAPVVALDQNRAAQPSASTSEAIRLAKDAAKKKKHSENQEKQIWIELITSSISTAPPSIRPRLQQLAARKNIPRKKKAFTNYMKCCLTEKNMDLIARCWDHLVACRDANPIKTPSKLPEVIDLTESPAERTRSVKHVAPFEVAVGSEAGAHSTAVSHSSTANEVVVIPSSTVMENSAGTVHARNTLHPDSATVSRAELKRKRPLASDLFNLSPPAVRPLILSDVHGSARKVSSEDSAVRLENELKPIDEELLFDVSEKLGKASAPESYSRSIPPSGGGADTAKTSSLFEGSTAVVNEDEPTKVSHNPWRIEERDATLSESNSLPHRKDTAEKREKVVVALKENDAGQHVLNARSKVLESLRKKALLKKRNVGHAQTGVERVGSCGFGVGGGARMRDNVPKATPDSYTLISSSPLPPPPPPQEITALSQRVLIRNISKTGPPARVRILGPAKVAPRNKIVKRDVSRLGVRGVASSSVSTQHQLQAPILKIEKARQKSEELQKNLATLKKRLAAKVKEKNFKKEPSACSETQLESSSGGAELGRKPPAQGVDAPGAVAYDEPADPKVAPLSALPASPDDGCNFTTTKRPLMPSNSDVVENLRKRQRKLRQEIDISNLKNMVKKQQDLLRKQKSKLKESKRLLEECNEEVERQCILVQESDEQLTELEKRRVLMNGMLLKATKRLLSARKKLNEERMAHAGMGKG